MIKISFLSLQRDALLKPLKINYLLLLASVQRISRMGEKVGQHFYKKAENILLQEGKALDFYSDSERSGFDDLNKFMNLWAIQFLF